MSASPHVWRAIDSPKKQRTNLVFLLSYSSGQKTRIYGVQICLQFYLTFSTQCPLKNYFTPLHRRAVFLPKQLRSLIITHGNCGTNYLIETACLTATCQMRMVFCLIYVYDVTLHIFAHYAELKTLMDLLKSSLGGIL